MDHDRRRADYPAPRESQDRAMDHKAAWIWTARVFLTLYFTHRDVVHRRHSILTASGRVPLRRPKARPKVPSPAPPAVCRAPSQLPVLSLGVLPIWTTVPPLTYGRYSSRCMSGNARVVLDLPGERLIPRGSCSRRYCIPAVRSARCPVSFRSPQRCDRDPLSLAGRQVIGRHRNLVIRQTGTADAIDRIGA
jgi:hypothetical protein